MKTIPFYEICIQFIKYRNILKQYVVLRVDKLLFYYRLKLLYLLVQVNNQLPYRQ